MLLWILLFLQGASIQSKASIVHHQIASNASLNHHHIVGGISYCKDGNLEIHLHHKSCVAWGICSKYGSKFGVAASFADAYSLTIQSMEINHRSSNELLYVMMLIIKYPQYLTGTADIGVKSRKFHYVNQIKAASSVSYLFILCFYFSCNVTITAMLAVQNLVVQDNVWCLRHPHCFIFLFFVKFWKRREIVSKFQFILAWITRQSKLIWNKFLCSVVGWRYHWPCFSSSKTVLVSEQSSVTMFLKAVLVQK